jgi:transposase-like protein
MTKKQGTTSMIDVKALLEGDGDYLRALVRAVVEATLEAEMTAALGAEKGERSAARLGYRSGYYGRTLVTRVGVLELRVPQDRDGRFSTRLFERYQRSEKALVAALAEMYVQGVSTRKVKAITEAQAGTPSRPRRSARSTRRWTPSSRPSSASGWGSPTPT